MNVCSAEVLDEIIESGRDSMPRNGRNALIEHLEHDIDNFKAHFTEEKIIIPRDSYLWNNRKKLAGHSVGKSESISDVHVQIDESASLFI